MGTTLKKLLFSIAIGALFLIPHIVRVVRIGSFENYSPYSAGSPSSTVWDETFMYVSEVNYMVQHNQLAYDTDSFEHRNEPFPYSVLPASAEVALTKVSGDLRIAQIVCHFVFPALSAWLLIALFCKLEASVSLAALLGLSVLVFGFSLRTVFSGNLSLLLHGLHSNFIETLQAARNPHPNISFPLFVGAIICADLAILKRSLSYSVLSGVLGGLLFYTYSFYAISWTLGCFLLVSLAFLFPAKLPKCISFALIADTVVALPYFVWMHASKLSGAYTNRAQRLGLIQSHLPSKAGVEISAFYLGFVAIALFLWKRQSQKLSEESELVEPSRTFNSSIVTWVCMLLGGICGLNMQILTGFNIAAEHHFPHMALQPCALILSALIVLLYLNRSGGRPRVLRATPYLFFVLYTACCVSQVNSGYNSAQYHIINPSDRQLFSWLQQESEKFDVVATTEMRLNITIPDYTHNSILVVDGSRSSGSDDEIVDRFLLANALVNVQPADVLSKLSVGWGSSIPSSFPSHVTYSYYMFESSPYFDSLRGNIREESLPGLMARYGEIRAHLPDELLKYRVDYIYTNRSQTPAIVPGWKNSRVLQTDDGTLWHLQRN